MLYPILKVLMMPLAALLYDTLGVGRLLLIQGALSVLAALIENRILCRRAAGIKSRCCP